MDTGFVIFAILIIVVLSICGILVFFQYKAGLPLGSIDASTITVNGYGEVMAVPDMSILQVTVESEAETPSGSASKNAVEMNKVLKELPSKEDVQTVEYSTIKDEKRPVYKTTNTVQVKVRGSSERASEVIQAVTDAGATRVTGPSFQVENIEKYEREAYRKALLHAEESAESFGKRLGPLLSITPEESHGFRSLSAPPPLQTGSQTVRRSVQVVYALQRF